MTELAIAASAAVHPFPGDTPGVFNTYPEVVAHIEAGSFHSEVDRHIARDTAEQICNNVRWNITADVGATALGSLCALVPVTDERGQRSIAGQTLGPGAERWIASRLDSVETDLTAPDGAWGCLPEPVKKELTYYGAGLHMELTSHCTVACSFCTFANKGKIATKASFNSVVDVMQYFVNNQPLGRGQQRIDTLYWGSDPFDVKWQDGQQGRDYRDIARRHETLSGGQERYLFTSTAVPIGEEFRVIAFMNDAFNTASNAKGDGVSHFVNRLSRTEANGVRVDHIRNVLSGTSPDGQRHLWLNRVNPARRGRAWNRADRITDWDMTGPNCIDGAIISVNGVRAVAMQGASIERPLGELTWPIMQEETDGLRKYAMPTHKRRPELDEPIHPTKLFPDVEVATLRVDGQGNLHSRTVDTWQDDPHRALLRVMTAWSRYYPKKHIVGANVLRLIFTQDFGGSVACIRRHLASGADNPSMREALRKLTLSGFIDAEPSEGTTRK